MTDKTTPAFPTQDAYLVSTQQGMTLRDYFAAKAMQGMVGREVSDMKWISTYAENAYKMADAMMEARKK